MTLGRSIAAIVAISCVGVVVPNPAAADAWNKETALHFRSRSGSTPAISAARSSSIQCTDADGSSTDANAAFKVLESPVGAKRIETRP